MNVNRTEQKRAAPPFGWQRAKLGEICRIVGGSTPNTGNPSFWDGDIVWITPSDLGKLKGRWLETSERKITDSGYKKCGAEMLPAGTTVLSSRAPIGYLGITEVPLCTNQGCKSFIPGEGVDAQFLYWKLRFLVPVIQELGSGATFAEVSKTTLEALEIMLPPLDEQKRIAAILNERMAAIDKARAAAEAQLEAANALTAGYLRQVFPKEGETLPSGWRWTRLESVCHIQLGKMLSPKSKTGVNSFPYLRNANVRWNRIETDDIAYMDFSVREQEKFLLKKDDLLICEGGEPGRCAIWYGKIDPCFYQKSLHRIRPLAGHLNPLYLMYRLWLGVLNGEFLSANAKTTIAHLPAVRLKKLAIPLPERHVQDQIVKKLDEQLFSGKRLSDRIESLLSEIVALPQALLRQAFNGEL